MGGHWPPGKNQSDELSTITCCIHNLRRSHLNCSQKKIEVTEVHQSLCSASSLFHRFVRTAIVAAGSPLGSAAGKRVRGAQAPPGATKLPGTKPEQREDAVSNRGMSFTRPFRLLGLLPHTVCAPTVNLYAKELSASLHLRVYSTFILFVRSKKFVMPFSFVYLESPRLKAEGCHSSWSRAGHVFLRRASWGQSPC